MRLGRSITRATVALFAIMHVCLSAYAGNTSQDTLDNKPVGVTLTGSSWTQVAKADPTRGKFLCQNVGSHNMGFYFAPYSNSNAAPSPIGIGSVGVLTIFPAGSYEPDGGWIDGAEIWVIGTTNDSVTCYLSTSQP